MAVPEVTSNREQRIRALGEEIAARAQQARPGAFDREYWIGRLLEMTMRDTDFKVNLFRLVDVLPVLQTSAQIRDHVREYLGDSTAELPKVFAHAVKLASGEHTGKLAARAVHKVVEELARRFIVGANPAEALPELRGLHKDGFAFTADLLGEATRSDTEAEAYERRYFDLIRTLQEETAKWPARATVDDDTPRANVSLKLTALDPHLDPVDPEGSVHSVMKRLLPIAREARALGVFLNLDMEQWDVQGITLDVFEALARHDDLRDWPHMGIAIQAYTKSALDDLARLRAIAAERGAPITIRLIKGAYWDFEIVHAKQHGYPVPVFEQKAETDAHFEACSQYLILNAQHLRPAFGSHNLRSLAHALVYAEERGLPKDAVEIQMLYGMAEPERAALRDLGYRVRVYCPVGELIPGMAYLVRRLLENTANEGFLRQKYYDGAELAELLAPPQPLVQTTSAIAEGEQPRAPFLNCPLRDFTDRGARSAFAEAVATLPQSFPVDVPVIVSGQQRDAEHTESRTCPSDPQQIVAQVHYASAKDAADAVAAANAAWPAWRDLRVEDRASLLEALADRLDADRDRISALQCYEVGKPWREADADVAEAIDFCRYYAQRARAELAPQPLGYVPGETNTLHYEGRGVCAVIAPWNFPLAILCGMTTAALVAGNTVVMKPAEQSSAIGHALFEHMRGAGFPPDVVHFLPGQGENIGKRLVEHRDVALIAFTGSKAVGLNIVETAGKTAEGQRQVKRVVCEMGGKNAIIVDADADFDEAVAGVLQSAFGYAGQKCSAASRLFVVEPAYDHFIRRFLAAVRSMRVAPALDPGCELPPVVDEEAHTRLINRLAETHNDADVEVLYQGTVPTEGYYVPPTVLRIDRLDHPIMREELFGPILTVRPVDNFDAALDAALDSEFALTGSVYSRRPAHLEEARTRFRVGNLYLNRGSTGAIVGRQPFGGFQLSGLGSKAGGPHYLLHFADPRAVSENTLRHGFSPDVLL